MNTTTIAANTAKAEAASTAPLKPSKSMRRMARPPTCSNDVSQPPRATSLHSERSPALAAGSKSAAVIALLSREGGATSAELIEATDWLPHTMRAALTGLRKKGHTIERGKRGTETCYTIKAATAE
jgi:hypothetical protein